MKIRITHRIREALVGYSFILIWIIGFIVFAIQPLAYSIYLSFHKVVMSANGVEAEFIGLDNYRSAFTVDPYFATYLVDFLRELVPTVVVVIVFSVIIAMLLNLKIKYKGFFRTIFFLPVIIMTGPVIQELIEQSAFELTNINNFPIIDYIRYNMNSSISSILITLMGSLILVLWYTGVQVLIFLAALQKIDKNIYEASRIDGASPWESFWKITLPTLTPMILVNMVYTIVMLSAFELNKVATHIKTSMFDIKTGFGYASSLAWIYFLIIGAALGILALVFVLFTKEKKR